MAAAHDVGVETLLDYGACTSFYHGLARDGGSTMGMLVNLGFDTFSLLGGEQT
jgi:hypothetical protein